MTIACPTNFPIRSATTRAIASDAHPRSDDSTGADERAAADLGTGADDGADFDRDIRLEACRCIDMRPR